MEKLLHVRVGSEVTFLEAQDGKPQVAYVDVVEPRSIYDKIIGDYIDVTPRWYRARFKGHDAETISEQFKKGDALIVYGDVEKVVYKDAAGKISQKRNLYVQSYGPDPRLTAFTISRKNQASQDNILQTRQEAAQDTSDFETIDDADFDAQFAEPEITSFNNYPAPNANYVESKYSIIF